MLKNSKISFILDGEIVVIDFSLSSEFSPTTTVLNYLRTMHNHKGVKEGCGIGDCGACTIVLAKLNSENKLEYTACNSCLMFLPMLNGKQLITIENIGTPENLHPIQQAMIEANASQCGFCTPGFVMSAFALFKNPKKNSIQEIIEYLSGNLCRCTGYSSIIEAVEKSCNRNLKDHFSEKENLIIKKLKQIKPTNIYIILKNIKYFQVTNLKDTLIQKEKFPNAKLISGNTDTSIFIKNSPEKISEILDLSNIAELKNIEANKSGIFIGSSASINDILKCSEKALPVLAEILKVFGSNQIRNLASLGGNIASASPIGDSLPVLMIYDTDVYLKSLKSERIIKLSDFISDYKKTQIEDNEIITKIFVRFPKKNQIIRSYKISKRKSVDISTVSGAFSIELNENDKVEKIVLYFGAMAAVPKRATKTENFLIGKVWDRQNVEQAQKFIRQDFSPISDARASIEGRLTIAENLLLKFWVDTQD